MQKIIKVWRWTLTAFWLIALIILGLLVASITTLFNKVLGIEPTEVPLPKEVDPDDEVIKKHE